VRLPTCALIVLGLVVTGCTDAAVQGAVHDTIPVAVRDAFDTMGSEDVRRDMQTLALSPEVHRILTQLTQDLLATAAGAARGPEVEASLRALIATAVDEIRHQTSDLTPALSTALDGLLADAEAMVNRVVDHAMRRARGMLDEDEIAAWVRSLLGQVLGDALALAGQHLDDGSAQTLGRFLRTAFRELLADVEVEDVAERVSRAAARGAGNGIADALRGDLGDVLHQERVELTDALRESSADAARPWIIVSGLGLAVVLGLAFVLYRLHRDHRATLHELEVGAAVGRTAQEVVHAAQARGVRVGRPPAGK
jgi:hypothetical protein